MPERLYREIVAHVETERPVEACGLIAFDGDTPVQVYPGTNILGSATRYRMEDMQVLRAVDDMDQRGWWLGAIYHSHPSTPAVPSTTDLREANWPDTLMLIVSLMGEAPELRAYRLHGQTAQEIPVEVTRERVPWLGTLRRQGLARAFNPVGRRTPRRAIWQPVGITPRPEVVATSGSEALPRSREHLDTLPERRAVVGILGGMGPLATVDLYRKIIETTPAATDQEHIPVLVYADPRVPDRTEALLRGGDDPTPWLVAGARALADLGADFIVIPCNTAHAFLDRVRPEVERPILSMIDAAADEIRGNYPDVRTVGLLATSGTISAGIYQAALASRGIEVLLPDDDVQRRCVTAAIREVKAGRAAGATAPLVEAAEYLTQQGAALLLEACTEIPIALQQRHVRAPLLDATAALARAAVATALHLDAAARSGDPQWETATAGWDTAAVRAAVR